MSQTFTLTVAISAITSAIVSFATFIVGVRIAKDQGDRTELRAIYQRWYEHFRALRDAIEDKSPKVWPDFPREGNQYMPPVRKAVETGEANLLPPNIASRCEQLERDVLVAGGKLRTWAEQDYTPELLKWVEARAPKSKDWLQKRTYRELRPLALALYSDRDLSELAAEADLRGLGIAIELATERGRTDPRYLYPEYLDEGGTMADALRTLWGMSQTDRAANEMRGNLHATKSQLDEMLTELSIRIRDPHPLLESVARSFKDVARGR